MSVVDRVSVSDVLRLGGFDEPNARGFLRCPLHFEHSPSFHMLASGKGFRCFGCGAKGGVLDLVVALGIAPNHALAAAWLDDIAA